MARRIIILAALFCAAQANVAPASSQTAADGRIVRVVYQVGTGGTWGFHLAHMMDGRYCVHFGNPGRLTLAHMERAANICFDTVPGAVDQTPERKFQAGDTSQQGKIVTISTHQKGSIETSGNDITLNITSCSKAEHQAEYTCLPNRYVVRMSGQDCSAEVTLFRGKAGATTCEHYAAR
jgi:hypothetical protein